jgi:phytoene synthase
MTQQLLHEKYLEHINALDTETYGMAKHSATFSWASRCLNNKTQQDHLSRLYTFCRYLDDLADDYPMEESQYFLSCVTEDWQNSLPDNPILHSTKQLCHELAIDEEIPQHLIESLYQDCGPQALQTEGDLIRYCYGVASTVGLMCCGVFAVQDQRALPFAIDLGIAMQLTNIARDV